MQSTMAQERRQQRTAQLTGALELAFASVARSFGLSHVALCDAGGLVWAGVGVDPDLEALGAFAPLLCRSVEEPHWRQVSEALWGHVPEASPGRVSVRGFEVGGSTLHLIAVGPRGAGKDVALVRAISAARRILRQG
jgi:hypothetical protein